MLHSMNDAYERFSYCLGGNEADYWYGVTEFHTMAEYAAADNMDGSRDASAVVGNMIYEPDLAKSHLGEICNKLGTCISDPNKQTQWAICMKELYDLLNKIEK